MAEYNPAYRQSPPLTIEHFEARLAELHPIYAYASEHDDVLVLDELFCRIVALEHRIILWERENEQQERPRVGTSLKELDRALKWAWLAREEEDHASGMYAGKLKEAIAVLEDLQVFLQSVGHGRTPAQQTAAGMTLEEADALAATIKGRLPLAEVEVREREEGGAWEVEARNPRRGTSQVFQSAEQFEQLMEAARQ